MPEKVLHDTEYDCDSECGEGVSITTHGAHDLPMPAIHAVPEALGWTTVDRGKRTLVFCPHCQKQQAKLITGGDHGNTR